ncbi:hypothetical protein [Phenylobacterium sp.]|uniref:hypothetical protein n=1 Tax=Phenylobacterium sp. TaxID=1871053 RepID=UPI003983C451
MAKTKLKAKAKSFLPKRIGGVKVPKVARKGRFGAFIASAKGQALIAEVVMAGVGMVMAKKVKDSPKARGAIAEAKAKATRGVKAAKKKASSLGARTP